MSTLYRTLALSPHPLARAARRLRRGVMEFTLPLPRPVLRGVVRPVVAASLALRALFYFIKRVFICEPFFKSYCASCGRGVRTGVFLHWVMGRGDIVLGDRVEVDGKCSFLFAARFSGRPTLVVGDRTIIRHGCSLVICKRITIGSDCLIASDVSFFESSGHPSDPSARRAGLPPRDEDVRPITVGDNVWIGQRAIVSPGETIGDNSIISAGSVVATDVPPNTVVAGFPARKVASLAAPDRHPEPATTPLPCGARP